MRILTTPLPASRAREKKGKRMGAWAVLPGADDLEDEPQGEGTLNRARYIIYLNFYPSSQR